MCPNIIGIYIYCSRGRETPENEETWANENVQ